MTMWSLLMMMVWLLPLVAADYNCSRNSTVIELFMFDFLRNFQLTAATVRKKTFDDPNHRMNITMSSKDTHRNVTIWSECNLNTTQRQLCVSCLGILITNIYDLCCEQRSSWGSINLRSDCAIAYNAPDYIVQGWTDPNDPMPKEVEKDPRPINWDDAPTIFPHHHLYFISFPALLLTSFIGMYTELQN